MPICAKATASPSRTVIRRLSEASAAAGGGRYPDTSARSSANTWRATNSASRADGAPM